MRVFKVKQGRTEYFTDTQTDLLDQIGGVLNELEPGEETDLKFSIVEMSAEEFDNLPEFQGF
jgi:hypothetical protein